MIRLAKLGCVAVFIYALIQSIIEWQLPEYDTLDLFGLMILAVCGLVVLNSK
jgi:hypothetical protein